MTNSKLTDRQCGICANCVPQINGGSGFNNCGEAHAAQLAEDAVMTNRLTAERMDDETLSELIEFRRDSAKYHAEQGHKHQAMLHDLVLNALLELQEYRKAAGEPVAWILTGIDGRKYIESDKTVVEMFSCFVGNKVEPLYATPQPAPAVEVVTVVPDEMDLMTCHLDGVTEIYAEGWNACRVAMLKGDK